MSQKNIDFCYGVLKELTERSKDSSVYFGTGKIWFEIYTGEKPSKFDYKELPSLLETLVNTGKATRFVGQEKGCGKTRVRESPYCRAVLGDENEQ
jgi:hypothetical protein